jgi:hypothetical protein
MLVRVAARGGGGGRKVHCVGLFLGVGIKTEVQGQVSIGDSQSTLEF